MRNIDLRVVLCVILIQS